jgi:hypothetical protein
VSTTPTDQFAQVASRLRTSSAVVPALILAGICSAVALPGLLFGPDALAVLFTIILVVGLLIPASQIVLFTFIDRDRLHNEEHIERKMLLARMRPEIGDGSRAVEVIASERLIPNPSSKVDGDA